MLLKHQAAEMRGNGLVYDLALEAAFGRLNTEVWQTRIIHAFQTPFISRGPSSVPPLLAELVVARAKEHCASGDLLSKNLLLLSCSVNCQVVVHKLCAMGSPVKSYLPRQREIAMSVRFMNDEHRMGTYAKVFDTEVALTHGRIIEFKGISISMEQQGW